jgi:Sec-independent protein translocase protein TatA
VALSLVIIGAVVVVLTAAAKVPAAAAAFLRACIPLVEAFHDLRNAIRRNGKSQQGLGRDEEAKSAVPSTYEQQLIPDEHPEHQEANEAR